MMLGALSLVKSTIGMKTIGRQSASATVQVSWERVAASGPPAFRIVRWIGAPQQAHSAPISNVRASFLNLPCTKGVAMASTPQAAFSRSPVLNVTG